MKGIAVTMTKSRPLLGGRRWQRHVDDHQHGWHECGSGCRVAGNGQPVTVGRREEGRVAEVPPPDGYVAARAAINEVLEISVDSRKRHFHKGYYVAHFNDDNVLSFIYDFQDVDRVNIKTEYEKLKASEKQSLSLIHSFDQWIFIHF
uniref:Uncharacterized protein n=1 Tax=Nymphaea colorata TaxID=210225 RepID=A0A5K0YVD3_9MAGN|nr:unnamed protein product [Nymphaea colorata]